LLTDDGMGFSPPLDLTGWTDSATPSNGVGTDQKERFMKKYLATFALFLALWLSPIAQNAQAYVGVRIGIGLPLYVGPGPYYYGGYPYYYAPPPTYVVPGPVVYQTAPPTVIVRTPGPGEAVAAPAPLPTPVANGAPSFTPLPPVTNVVAVSNQSTPQISALVRQLSDANETVRRDAAIELGRQKAHGAVDALINTLAKDGSPIAREGAARGLGLIASPRSMSALIYAAQADNDREVRHSCQFAVEAIRSNLRGN
jgi:HEAT repeats